MGSDASAASVCATGTYIWLGKRRRRGIEEPRLRGAWHGLDLGTPAALAITLVMRFVLGNDFPFAITFWIVQAAAIVVGAMGYGRNAGGAGGYGEPGGLGSI